MGWGRVNATTILLDYRCSPRRPTRRLNLEGDRAPHVAKIVEPVVILFAEEIV
jgi:hypothetical protein